MKRPYHLILIVSSIILGIIAGIPGVFVRASGPGTTVQVFDSIDYFSNDIVDPTLTFGSRFTMDIEATDIPPINPSDPSMGGINAFDITVTYNSTVLRPLFVSHKALLCPASDNCLFDRPSALPPLVNGTDSPEGTTRLAVALAGDRVDGSGILFRIVFEVVGTGFTVIALKQPDSLIALGATSVPYKPVNGRFENRKPFRLDPDPLYAAIAPGGDAVYNISLTQVWKIQNFTESISFGISGLPGAELATFNPTSGTLNFTTKLTVSTTTATPLATYTLTITGISADSNTRVTANVTMVVATRDVAVVRVAATPTNVSVADDVNIAVDVKNNGNQAETIDLNIDANGTAIFPITGIILNPLELQTITRVWSTVGVTLGGYEISADIPVFTGDSDPSNNILIDGIVHVGSDFTIFPGQISGSLVQGDSITVSIDVSLVSAAPQPELVSLSLTGLGSGVSVEFTPETAPPTFTAIMNLTASASATTGTFSLTITATSPTFTRTAPFTLAVVTAHDVAVVVVSNMPSVVNPGATVTIQVTVRNNGALTESFTVNVTAVPSSGSPTITAGTAPVANLDPGQSTIVTVLWTTPSTSGMYTFTAKIAPLSGEQNTGDNTMSGGGTKVNAPPTASFTSNPSPAESGSSTAVDASASIDTDGSIATYAWDFGDGATATGKTASHTYSSAGTYTVTLTVTDENGATSTVKHAVLVVAPGGPVAFLTSPTGIGLIIIVIVALLALALYLRRRRPKMAPAKPAPKTPTRK